MDEKKTPGAGETRYDGYMNVLNRFGTSQDNGEAYRFTPETMVDDMTLAAHYEGDGLFTKIIDIPAEKAATREFDLNISDETVTSLVTDALEDLDWMMTTAQAIKWSRLFGGAIAVMIIDDGGGLEDPVNWNAIKGVEEIVLYERAVVEPDYSYLYGYAQQQTAPKRFRPKVGRPQFFRVYSQFGCFVVHESRCLVFRNGVLPETTTQADLRFWGMPEYNRLKRALRETVTNHSNGARLLERSVQGIYKMKGMTSTLSMEGGDEKVLRRLKTIDAARGILNSIVIDSDGEDYGFQTFQLSGFSEAVNAACNMLSAITNIPQTILFGRSPAGENSTGEADLENWYNYLGQISDLQIKGNLQRLLDVLFRGWLNTGKLTEEPNYKLEFKPFWNLSEMEQADLDQKRASTEHIKAQTAQIYCDLQVIDPSEVRRGLAKSEEFNIEELLDGEDTDGDVVPGLEEALASLRPTETATDSEDQEAGSVGVIVVKDGKVLCGIRKGDTGSGLVCGPGGHVEDGETPRQAAIRETMEEFGIKLKNLTPFGQGPREPGTGLTPQLFISTEYEGKPKCDEHEMTLPMFVPLDDLMADDKTLFKPFADSIAILKEQLGSGQNNTS